MYFGFVPHALVEMSVKCSSSSWFFFSKGKYVFICVLLLKRVFGRGLKESLRCISGTAVAQWLRCCATNRKVAGLIPAGVNGFFSDIKFFRSHYGSEVD